MRANAKSRIANRESFAGAFKATHGQCSAFRRQCPQLALGLFQQGMRVLVGFHQLREFSEVFFLHGIQTTNRQPCAKRAGVGVIPRGLNGPQRMQRPQAGERGQWMRGCPEEVN